jgi:serine/threonine protein kinase
VTEPTEVGSTTNRYELLAKLATGGMAEIFLARANLAGVQRFVVLKRVLQQRAENTHFVQMFLDEARLSAQLQHANIAQVHDIGIAGTSFFFTMEYVHGVSLTELQRTAITKGVAIPIPHVLTVIAGAGVGLHYAHEKLGLDGKPLGIVHRDVSPSNLMITYEGTVKVVDFGIAKAAHRNADTKIGTVKGKLSYMSPEQCRGLELDRRSDLFSLGIVMWEMLTGTRLFKRETEYDHMEAIVLGPTPPPSSVRDDVPRELDAIVLKLLAKSPADRYQTAEELVEAIEGYAMMTSAMLSTTALGKYVREMCGRRPEPWLAVSASEDHEVLTVSTPVPRLEGETITVPASARGASLPLADGTIPSTASYSYGALAQPQIVPLPGRRRYAWWLVLAAAAGGAVWYAATRASDKSDAHPIPAVAPTAPPAPVVPPPAATATVVAPPDAVAIDPIAAAFGDKRYADVVAACQGRELSPGDAAACVTAACVVHDLASARKWIAQVAPAERAGAMQACKPASKPQRAGTPVKTEEHAHGKPDCDTNPLACQF